MALGQHLGPMLAVLRLLVYGEHMAMNWKMISGYTVSTRCWVHRRCQRIQLPSSPRDDAKCT